MTISIENAKQARLFARLASAAYGKQVPGQSVRDLPGLRALKNEKPFASGQTDTQGFLGTWNNDIVVAFRGSEQKSADWLGTNARVGLVRNRRGAGRVHTGFQRAADSVYQQVKGFIRSHRGDGTRVFLCGHSLGGALAVLTAGWLSNDRLGVLVRGVFTYGAPRVGCDDYVEQWRSSIAAGSTFAWVAEHDLVPHIPPDVYDYRHVARRHYELSETCGDGDHCVRRVNLDRTPADYVRDILREVIPKRRQLFRFLEHVDRNFPRVSLEAHDISRSYLRKLNRLVRLLNESAD